MLVWMVIENGWKPIFLLCKYISQGYGYVFESVQNDLLGCDYEFMIFNIVSVLIILGALLIL